MTPEWSVSVTDFPSTSQPMLNFLTLTAFPPLPTRKRLLNDLSALDWREQCPYCYFIILCCYCRVTENSSSNQMPASNLGIVFGPTLLKPSEDMASLSILMDTPHQVRILRTGRKKAFNLFWSHHRLEKSRSFEDSANFWDLQRKPVFFVFWNVWECCCILGAERDWACNS